MTDEPEASAPAEHVAAAPPPTPLAPGDDSVVDAVAA